MDLLKEMFNGILVCWKGMFIIAVAIGIVFAQMAIVLSPFYFIYWVFK